MEELKVKKVIIGIQLDYNENYKKFIELINEKKINVIVVQQGNKVYIEKNLYLDILWPNPNNGIQENSINNNALVFNMHYKEFSMLFTGDIEQKAEEILISEYENTNKLKSLILKVAHHGSKTSSKIEFLKLVNPKISLIGVGKKNKFGHPNTEVLENLKNLNSDVYRTDKFGEIIIEINNNGSFKINSLHKF